ncbi:MAG: ribonuclease P protein component [Propionibacteriaceae bacterium]|nr:ribonuclease P protein component [Propionibacteriaceae bacterium]
MLPSGQRLRASRDFANTFRRGVKVTRPCLVLYALPRDSGPARAGFAVSKAVGNAVVRNRVRRRLRHLIAPKLAQAPMPVDFVVRATPRAVAGDLGAALNAALASCYAKLER